MGIRSQISEILRTPARLSEITGKPVDKASDIAMNAAGLLAVSEAVGIFAFISGDTGDKGYGVALDFFCSIPAERSPDRSADVQHEIAKRIAHATWAQSQIYRGMIETPLTPFARLERKRSDDEYVLAVYDLLPPEEVAKDWEQVQKYAIRLRDLITKLAV